MSAQVERVLAALRKLIIAGDLRPGEAAAEIPLSQRLGVSRTPIRIAVRTLEQEGLLAKVGSRGYVVREIRPGDIADAIEVRAVLEGLAARLAAEHGLARSLRATLAECLAAGDRLFEKGHISEEDIGAYQEMNKRFHAAILEAGGNRAIAGALARNDHLPIASANSVAFDRDALEREFHRFYFAHTQHHIVFEALEQRQGARAEAVMREHAHVAFQYAELLGSRLIPERLRVVGGEPL
jgi:GntR family transcriptional regulator of vanillate catabolism